jgi:hypothetical protein
MGQPPERASRLHFRAASISGEDAHGPGSGECRRASAGGTGESSAGGSCNSCSLARAKRRSARGKPSSCSRCRFAVSSVANFQTNWIAFPCEFSDSITGGGCHIAGAKRITNSEPDCIAFPGGFSCDVTVSSTPK